MSHFERQLQGLLASSDEINKSENDLVADILNMLGGWAAAKQRNSDVLRQRVAALAQIQPSAPPLPNGVGYPVPGAVPPAGTRQAIDNLRRQGIN